MRTTDDLSAAVRAEFARLETDDAALVGRLQERAASAVSGLDPASGAEVALAVVEAAHEVATAPAPAPGPTVGELSARRLLVAALRPRRTTGSGA